MEAILHNFHGFYNSIHDDNLEHALKSIHADDCGEPRSDTLQCKLFDAISWKDAHEQYAKEYTEVLSHEISVPFKFIRLISPKYYNFETDRILVSIEESEVIKLFHCVEKDTLKLIIKDMYTSYDGYISHYSNDINKWLKKPIEEWDHNEVGTLLLAYMYDTQGIDRVKDNAFEYSLAEKLYESADIIISNLIPERYWKVINYLYDRSQR